MWTQFVWENLHFAVNLFTALAFFSVFWLYFDAWVERKTLKEGLKILGFLFLSFSFLAHAVLVESSGLSVSIFRNGLSEKISLILRSIGYISLICGLIIDPLLPKPKLAAITLTGFSFLYLIPPLGAAVAAWLYLRRATIGLENHTKSVSLSFFFLSVYEMLSLSYLFTNSSDINIFRLVAPFGPIWVASHFLLLIGAGIIIKWAFSYLLKRINTQLFIIFTTTILSIFLFTTVSFTFLLLKNLSDETLSRLSTDVSVLSFALDAKKSEALASASILAQNTEVIEAIKNKDRKILNPAAENILLSRKVNGVVILDASGQVIARGEDKDRVGDSMSSLNIVKRAIIGESVATLSTIDATIAPAVQVRAAVPIKLAGKVIGITVVTQTLDNSFLDGVKKVTGLEVTIFGNDILSATTISDFYNETRPIGIRETNQTIKEIVLTKNQDYSGLTSLLNTSYFAVYHPLQDINNETIGMLLAGRPASSIFTAAGKSIELTFLVTIILIIFSTIPSFIISKYITNQLD